jgi:peptidyl-prolyl cis-trans isomerase C
MRIFVQGASIFMKKLSFIAGFFFLGTLLQNGTFASKETAVSSEASKDQASKEPLAAKVGKKTLTIEEINRQRDQMLGGRLSEQKALSPELAKKSFEIIRDQWVIFTLLTEAAEHNRKALEKDSEIGSAIQKAVSQILMGAYVDKFLKANINPEALKKAYDASLKDPKLQIYVATLRAIFVDSEEIAKSVIKALKGGASFVKLAEAKSVEKTSGKEGGLLPTTLESKLPAAYQKALKELKPGGFTENPLPISGKWSILQLEKRAIATFEQAESELRDRESRKQMSILLARLAKDKKYGVAFYNESGEPTQELSPLFADPTTEDVAKAEAAPPPSK